LKFNNRVTEILGVEIPIVQAPMGWIARSQLASAVSNAGALGIIETSSGELDIVKEEIRKMRDLTDKPFGVDLLAALPEDVLSAIDIIIEEGASAFIAGLGVPGPIVQKCHDNGVLVMSMCGKVSHAVAAQEAGCDAVVAQGTEAGGHTGKVAGMALIPQVVDAVDIPVLGAGSIVDGRGLAAVLALGAQGAWMGTRFIASHEARAGEAYKKQIGATRSEDTIVTRCYSGKPMRVISNSHVELKERTPGAIQRFPEQMYASMQEGVMVALSGATEGIEPDRHCMPCGQGAGAIDDILSCQEIIDNTMAEAQRVLSRLGTLAG